MAVLLAPPTKNAVQKTLAAQLLSSAGASDPITFDDVDGLPNLPGVLVINRVDENGTSTPSKREYIEYSGTSGNTVLITTRNVDGGNSALTHAVGSIVEFIPDVIWADRIYDALATVTTIADTTVVNTTNVVTPAGTQTLTNKTLTSPTINSPTITTPTIDTIASTRVNPRTTTETSSATPTINTDNTDMHTITALATDITSFTTNLSGTPVNGQKLIIRILDNGTARSITWGASFASRGATLPTTTVLSKYQYNGFIWNSTTSTWDLVATVDEA